MAAFTPVVRVGVGCVVTSLAKPGFLLLGQRLGSHGAGKFALPGGHLELGESWEDCALREVKEETNLTIDSLKLLSVTNDPCIDGKPEKHYVTLFMVGQVTSDSENLSNMEPHKCAGWDWVTWDELQQKRHETPDTLFEPMVHMIDNLEQEGKTPFA